MNSRASPVPESPDSAMLMKAALILAVHHDNRRDVALEANCTCWWNPSLPMEAGPNTQQVPAPK
ncbi:hypothetical protein O9993_15655 [Vibrio lentus]|nr:hypothetical protein [Vibrio lentus]